MKEFWILLLVIGIMIIGFLGIALYIYFDKQDFHYWFIIPSLLVLSTSAMWWVDYFKNLFNIKD